LKRPRVLELVASSHGGGAVHVRDLAVRVDSSRYEVLVAMPEDGGNVQRQEFEAAGISFYAAPISAGASVRALRPLVRLVATVDLVHAHGARAALYGRLAALSLGRRRPSVVYTIHGFAAPHYAWWRRTCLLGLERALSDATDAYVAVCRAEREAIVGARVAEAGRVRVIYNGIDAARYARPCGEPNPERAGLGSSASDRAIITVCRLNKPRDFATLLQAFRLVLDHRGDVRLLIVGDGPYRANVEALVAELDLLDKVALLGMRQDVPELLAASDLFVLSTAQWEGLPLTVLEAMASGLPVVASDVGGVPEAVTQGETGLVVPPRSPQALASAMEAVLANADLARRMGRAGAERVASHFCVERMVAETVALYDAVLARRGSTSGGRIS